MTTQQEYANKIANVAKDILADAHAQLLNTLANDSVFVMKNGARSEINTLLHRPSPFTYQAGRFRFTAAEVKSIVHTETQWLIVLF